GHRVHDAIDATLEVAGKIVHRRAAVGSRLRARLGLGFFHLAHAQRVVLEDLNRLGHLADFVAAAGAGNVAVEFTAGNAFHPSAELVERTADAAADHPGDAAGDHADADGGKSEHPDDRLQLHIEVVEIGAGAEVHVEAGHRDGVADLAD